MALLLGVVVYFSTGHLKEGGNHGMLFLAIWPLWFFIAFFATRYRRKQLATLEVRYHQQTPVVDVGTDSARYLDMKGLSKKLNRLLISQWMETKIRTQIGHVPPPLDGIWARYPYFHNNSIPNLCALLSQPKHRPQIFWVGPADKKEHFDTDCVGYFVRSKTPAQWKQNPRQKYDTTRSGMGNSGHFQAFIDEAGEKLLTREQKKDLIEFLKTL